MFFGNRLCIVKLLSFFLSRQENAHGGNNNEPILSVREPNNVCRIFQLITLTVVLFLGV